VEASRLHRLRRASAAWLFCASAAMSAHAAAQAPDYSATLDAMWDFDAPARSGERFRVERERHAAQSREALEASTQLARTLGLQRRFAEADALLDEIERRVDAAPTRVRVRYLLERGRVRNSSGEAASAVPLFHAAVRASDDDTSPGAAFYRIDALHMLGIADAVERRAGWDRQALAAAEAATDPRARNWRGSLLHNLGWEAHDAGRYAEALDYWQRALALREASGDAARTRIARWTVARGLRSLGRLDEAWAAQQALAVDMERVGAPDGFVYEELAEIALARGDADAARPYAAKAYAALRTDEGLKATAPQRLARLARLGEVAP
jgi:tetratricopeptide (TPR) repeat protein